MEKYNLEQRSKIVQFYFENQHSIILTQRAYRNFFNVRNCRIWGTENPRAIVQHQMHPVRCTVWCGVTSKRIIGPYFFENGEGDAVNVDGPQYRTMIENFLRQEVENRQAMWFQQDGATTHTARQTMALLREIFDDRIISRFSNFNWSSRAPDLTAPDYFLWGYLKGRVYANKPRTIQQLKANIRDEIQLLGPDILTRVTENALERARQVEAESGRHLKDIIFKK